MTTCPTTPDEQPTWLPTGNPDAPHDKHDDFGFENAPENGPLDSWNAEPNFESVSEQDEEDTAVSSTQIEIMLSAVSGTSGPGSTESNNNISSDEIESQPAPEPVEIFSEKRLEQLDPSKLVQLDPLNFESEIQVFAANDLELIEAYLDDSHRCLGSMEQAAMATETSPTDRDSIQQFCRELHTLKGASATVGLTTFANELHCLETRLDSVFSSPNETVDVEALFDSVDQIRTVIDQLLPSSSQESESQESESQQAQKKSEPFHPSESSGRKRLRASAPRVVAAAHRK